jgi:hypothetical protein
MDLADARQFRGGVRGHRGGPSRHRPSPPSERATAERSGICPYAIHPIAPNAARHFDPRSLAGHGRKLRSMRFRRAIRRTLLRCSRLGRPSTSSSLIVKSRSSWSAVSTAERSRSPCANCGTCRGIARSNLPPDPLGVVSMAGRAAAGRGIRGPTSPRLH